MVEHKDPQPRKESPTAPSGRRWVGRRASRLADPHVTYTGPVAVWWIPKPRGPRISLRSAAIAWFVAALVLAVTVLFLKAESRPLWPFGRRTYSITEILMRYDLVLLVCLVYVTMQSLGVWIRYRRLARQDVAALDAAIQAEQWELSALLLHRYCLLVSAIWRRVPARVKAWDSLLSRRLPRHRRVYVYYGKAAPPLPADATASFSPAIFPPPQPPLWAAAGLIPVGFLLYGLILDIAQQGQWQRAILFNVVLLGVILICYGMYFLTSLLGRSRYFRFAPGLMQWIKFTVSRRRPVIETFDLRRINTVIDLSSAWPGLTLLNTPGYRRETFRLPKGSVVIDALLRALLSTAPTPPLPEDQLVG